MSARDDYAGDVRTARQRAALAAVLQRERG